jgi:hypothetical protein
MTRVSPPSPLVRHFRQILLWPLQIIGGDQPHKRMRKHWECLQRLGGQCAWREVKGAFAGDPRDFKDRYYKEFVTFLPYVQRFLYGESGGQGEGRGYGDSPIRVFRRQDIARVRLTYQTDQPPVNFDVEHVSLCFFYDIDIIILVVEIVAEDLPLSLAQDTLFKFGRAYPAFWEANGLAGQCLPRVEWLSWDDHVLATSDYEDRSKYLSFVCKHRTPAISTHWEYLLRPLGLYQAASEGVPRYRQIEYHRMPLMAYLGFDRPGDLAAADFVRLGLVTKAGDSDSLPYAEESLDEFERTYCYNRFWDPNAANPSLKTRYLCCGHAFLMVGNAGDPFFTNPETGLLGQFRHQYFLLCLIPHFHKAALHLFSERIVNAISQLDIYRYDSVKQFKREIRLNRAAFLRFAHRYWFHEVSNQTQARDLFKLLTGHLGTDQLYANVSGAVKEMNEYLDSDDLRRQANTVTRLTVVTTLSVIGTVATGFLGMNLFAEAEQSVLYRAVFFFVVLIPAVLLTFYTVAKSKALAEFLDAVSNERLTWRVKSAVLAKIWRKPSRPS